ncbi:hypothetical protein JTB14_028490 [Gonioctena quinquepunctata]|nr:hypothetical protein JTB14_028490 [Gonioctena quinquepunctata]
MIRFSYLEKEHRSNDCSKKQKCTVAGCNENHQQHNDFQNKDSSIVTSTAPIVAHNLGGYGYREILLRIKPVTIISAYKKIKTYALFDEASTITLMKEDLADSMGLGFQKA